MLHDQTDGLVELTPGTRRANGSLWIDRRRHREHFLPGGGCGDQDWLRRLLAHADRIVAGAYARSYPGERPGEEVFVGAAPRLSAAGNRQAVTSTSHLWIDFDAADRLDLMWSFLLERPCHLLIASGGSGGVHAYWKLAEPLPSLWLGPDGTETEPIERANRRIVHALEDQADERCVDRARVMRLAGTINHKSGGWARVLEADFELAAYPVDDLVGDLPDPKTSPSRARGQASGSGDPYKQIPPPEYFLRLAGIRVPSGGLVSCPVRGHRDHHPSCSVGVSADQGWCCHSSGCGARGAIYDLASVLDGGPWGPALRGAAFARARARVLQAFGQHR